MVGTTNRSVAAMSGAWLRRKVRHRWDGGPHRLTILRDAGLSDLKAELEQLAMDARGAPQRIVNTHPPDQCAQIRGDPRPASKGAGFPTPVPAKAGPMPTHQGLGPDNRDGLKDRWKP